MDNAVFSEKRLLAFKCMYIFNTSPNSYVLLSDCLSPHNPGNPVLTKFWVRMQVTYTQLGKLQAKPWTTHPDCSHAANFSCPCSQLTTHTCQYISLSHNYFRILINLLLSFSCNVATLLILDEILNLKCSEDFRLPQLSKIDM